MWLSWQLVGIDANDEVPPERLSYYANGLDTTVRWAHAPMHRLLAVVASWQTDATRLKTAHPRTRDAGRPLTILFSPLLKKSEV